MALTLSDILNATDTKIEKCPVPEWGGDVYLRVISGTERDEYDQFLRTRTDEKGRLKEGRMVRQKLLTLALCDEKAVKLIQSDADGKKLFDAKNSAILCRLFDAAQRLNYLNDSALEDSAKNSNRTEPEISG